MQNVVTVCVDEKKNMDIAGRICHRSLCEAQKFLDMNQLLLKIESVFDRVKYPAASMEHRVFGKSLKVQQEKRDHEMGKIAKEHSPGKKATFVVQVQCRQNATWQGQVVWSEKNEVKHFRSALELIRLIDSATQAEEV
ncbi:MAG: hypothetical protein VB081_04135 [Christensenella sp.]|uniref:hypothetical protein n=1 Tax=Christensenella sp. TaxID=1935934 RepID=UPI002B21F1BF|nr:hypothetical protein [Christensenella sp.]MEA5002668.1 hypothetical protein [Christensenella sp.]